MPALGPVSLNHAGETPAPHSRLALGDDFLRIGDREDLTHAGGISHEVAVEKAELEYKKFRQLEAERDEPSPVEKDFEEAVKELKKLPKRSS